MDKQRIAAALSILIGAKHFMQRVRQLEELIENWSESPLLFGGALEPLNSLIDVGLADRVAFGKLIALAQAKRREVPAAKKVDYQRELMREKRERVDRAIRLEELVRGAPLRGEIRAWYKKDLQQRWMRERNEFIAKKGNLSWKQRNEAAGEYWAKVDAQLLRDLAEAQAVLDRPPVKRKRVVKVAKPQRNTAMQKAFDQASSRKRTA